MYGTLDGWRSYALERGDSAPTDAPDAEATAALVRGSDYVRLRYVANFLVEPGYTPTGHALSLVEEGAYISAKYELSTPGFFQKTFTPAEQKVLTGAGGIEWTPVGPNAPGGGTKRGVTYSAYPVVTSLEALFEPYVLDRNSPDPGLWAVGK